MELTYRVELPEFVAELSQDLPERGGAFYAQLDPDIGIPAWANRLGIDKKKLDRYMIGVIKRCMRREVTDILGGAPVRFRILKGSTKNGRSVWHPGNFPLTMKGTEFDGRDNFREFYNPVMNRVQPAGMVIAPK